MMRDCNKNKRTLYYAKYQGNNPIKDEWGNDTLEVEKIYGDLIELKVNYSSNVGQDTTNVFGNLTNYSRTISLTGSSCPLSENDILWINISTDKKANYEVLKVADSVNSYLIALREIV